MPLRPFRPMIRDDILPLAFALTAVALAIPFIGYITDDTFIYLRFAGNIADGHGFSFNPGEPAYGFTSPLWTLLLAAGARCGFDSMVFAKILGGIFLVASVPAFDFASRRIVHSQRARLAALAVWTSNAWMIRWSLSGMETAMAVFLVLISVAVWMADRDRGRLPFLPAFLMGLAALTRPECLGLAAIACLDTFLHHSRRLQAAVAFAVGFCAFTIPWVIFANAHFGAILPHTVFAKGGSWSFNQADLAWAIKRVGAIVCATSLVEASLSLITSILALRALSLTAIRDWLRIRFLPAAWTLALLALYSLRGESALVSRYLLPAICWIVLFGFAAIETTYASKPPAPDEMLLCARGLKRRRRHGCPAASAVWIVAAVVIIQNLLMLYLINYPSAMRTTRSLNGPIMEIAYWIRENTPREATIGLMDIGVIGFYSNRTVVDLHGHLDRRMYRARGRTRIERFVRDLDFAAVSRPDYLVERLVGDEQDTRGGLWTGVREPLYNRHVGDLGIWRRGEFHYTVYRMHWDRYDALRNDGRASANQYETASTRIAGASGFDDPDLIGHGSLRCHPSCHALSSRP